MKPKQNLGLLLLLLCIFYDKMSCTAAAKNLNATILFPIWPLFITKLNLNGRQDWIPLVSETNYGRARGRKERDAFTLYHFSRVSFYSV